MSRPVRSGPESQTCAAVDVEEHVWELEEGKFLIAGTDESGSGSYAGALGREASWRTGLGLSFLSSRSSVSSRSSDRGEGLGPGQGGVGGVGGGVGVGGSSGVISRGRSFSNSIHGSETFEAVDVAGRANGYKAENGYRVRGSRARGRVGGGGGQAQGREGGGNPVFARMLLSLGRSSTVVTGR